MKIQIRGVVWEVVTVSGLAKICDKSVSYIRKCEERKILPEANIRTADTILSTGKTMKGYRYYTKDLAEKTATIFKTFSQGKAIHEQSLQQLRDLFTEERLAVFPN